MKAVFFLLTILMIIACSSDEWKRQEVTTEHFKTIFFIDKDSLKQGLYVELTMENDSVSSAHYKDGKLDGRRMIYNEAGHVETIEHYKMDVFHGPETTFFPNGSIRTKGNFTNGQLDSLFYVYYENGALKEKVSMKNNEENGPFQEYYINGQVHWNGTFINGNHEVGLLTEYDEKGEIIKKMDCGLYKGEYICQTIWSLEKGAIKPNFSYDE